MTNIPNNSQMVFNFGMFFFIESNNVSSEVKENHAWTYAHQFYSHMTGAILDKVLHNQKQWWIQKKSFS